MPVQVAVDATGNLLQEAQWKCGNLGVLCVTSLEATRLHQQRGNENDDQIGVLKRQHLKAMLAV